MEVCRTRQNSTSRVAANRTEMSLCRARGQAHNPPRKHAEWRDRCVAERSHTGGKSHAENVAGALRLNRRWLGERQQAVSFSARQNEGLQHG